MLKPYHGELSSGQVTLRLDRIVSREPGEQEVPYYHFAILNETGSVVGHINFRVGDTRHVVQVAGHIGYEINEEHRGRAYSYHACLALRLLLKKHYEIVILTVDPENAPSIRIIEKLGGRFVGEIEVPSDDPAYASGARRKRRYEWAV